jgi:DNA-binding response OmpR family regulator
VLKVAMGEIAAAGVAVRWEKDLAKALQMARSERLDGLVVDLTVHGGGGHELGDEIHDALGDSGAAVVFIGTDLAMESAVPGSVLVPSPLHADELITAALRGMLAHRFARL